MPFFVSQVPVIPYFFRTVDPFLSLALGITVRPEQFIQGFVKLPADCYTKIDRGVVIPFFDRADRLSGHPDQISKLLLREILGDAR